MNLAEEERNFLKLCGKDDTVSSREFEDLLKLVSRKVDNALDYKENTESDGRRNDEKVLEMALTLVLTLSSKENIDYTSFCSLFYELDWNVERINRLWSMLDEKKYRIRGNLTSSTTHPPQIIDIRWKLDYIMKSFGGNRKNLLCYVITLTVQHCSAGRISFLTFSCSLAQMTSLLTRLKQATRCIKNYSEKLQS